MHCIGSTRNVQCMGSRGTSLILSSAFNPGFNSHQTSYSFHRLSLTPSRRQSLRLLIPCPRASYKRFPTLTAAQTYLLSRDPKKPKRSRKEVWHVDPARKAFGYTPLHVPPPAAGAHITHRQQQIVDAYTAKYASAHALPFHLRTARDQGFTLSSGRAVVWTDGSAVKNGRRGARAGSGVFWGRTGVAAGL